MQFHIIRIVYSFGTKLKVKEVSVVSREWYLSPDFGFEENDNWILLLHEREMGGLFMTIFML